MNPTITIELATSETATTAFVWLDGLALVGVGPGETSRVLFVRNAPTEAEARAKAMAAIRDLHAAIGKVIGPTLAEGVVAQQALEALHSVAGR